MRFGAVFDEIIVIMILHQYIIIIILCVFVVKNFEKSLDSKKLPSFP